MNNETTIGLDLGNKKHKVVGLDGRGKVILKCELSNDKETLGAFFKEHADATPSWGTPASSAPSGKARRRTTGRTRR